MESFCKNLPKIELHAHINGSISNSTMNKLIELKRQKDAQFSVEQWMTCIGKGEKRSLEECFKMFKLIHQISDNADAVYMITKDVIREFAEDGVKYLELRSTPREVSTNNMTKRQYVESVIKAINECQSDDNLDIIVRLILAIDRRNDIQVALDTVNLAAEFKQLSQGIVVGVDMSGDPSVGDARSLIPAFEEARKHGLKLALHLAEVPNKNTETEALLDEFTDRIGHGTFLLPEDGGSEAILKTVVDKSIPLELCLTSNVKGQTVKSFDIHHFKFWYERNHPCVICTDDKGVFATSLSTEYQIAATAFSLSKKQLWELSQSSIDCIFSGDDIKLHLRQKFDNIKNQLVFD
ncbi:N6-Methyl-AMP deaminase-like [Tubulanus polymorphus]|uniref:N6-Methyl-AMP deaminase-like n=1 Tax=Tubulanus polymorphus TaxID=672921 RepID=UPI003DA656B8